MKSNKYMAIVLAATLVAALSAAGCVRGIASGGGTIPSKHPEMKGATKASFGFWGDSCGDTTTGNFNYHDKSAGGDYGNDGVKGGGVKMVGPVADTCDCMQGGRDADEDCSDLCLLCWFEAAASVWECLDDCTSQAACDACIAGFPGYLTAIAADYYSTNPKLPDIGGDQNVYACVADYGEGHNADADDQLFVFVDGGPYDGYHNGGNVSGNIQAYPCPDAD